MKMKIFIASLVLLLVASTASSFAFEKPEQPEQSERGILSQRGLEKTDDASRPGQLQSCQSHEAELKNRMTHLTTLTTDMQTKFASIAARVETYYTTKVVPSGKTVSNYSALTANIATQNKAVTSALTTAQTDVNNFSCSSASPKSELTQFRTDMQAVKRALKDYRTSIKDLIVAVRSVVGEENAEQTKTP